MGPNPGCLLWRKREAVVACIWAILSFFLSDQKGEENDEEKNLIQKEICERKLRFLQVYSQTVFAVLQLTLFVFLGRIVQGIREDAMFEIPGQWMCLVVAMVVSSSLFAPGVYSISSLNCWYAFAMVASTVALLPVATKPGWFNGMPLLMVVGARIPGSVFATRCSLVLIFNVMSSALLIVLQRFQEDSGRRSAFFGIAVLVHVIFALTSVGTWLVVQVAFSSRAKHQVRSWKMATESRRYVIDHFFRILFPLTDSSSLSILQSHKPLKHIEAII